MEDAPAESGVKFTEEFHTEFFLKGDGQGERGEKILLVGKE